MFICFLFVSNQEAADSLVFAKMERQLRRIKNTVFPVSPKTIKEIVQLFGQDHIMQQFGVTKHDQPLPFFHGAFEEADFGFCVFVSRTTIDLITKSIEPSRRHYLMDATFKIVPVGPFKQFLIIYVEYIEHVSDNYIN